MKQRRAEGRRWPDTARLCAAARAQTTRTGRPATAAHVATWRADAAKHGHPPDGSLSATRGRGAQGVPPAAARRPSWGATSAMIGQHPEGEDRAYDPRCHRSRPSWPTEENDHVTERRTRIETETAPVRVLSPAQGEVPVPGPRAGRPPAHSLLRLLPVPAGSAPRTVPRGPRGAPVSVPPAPDASTDRPSSDHARPPGDAEHDGATEAGDPAMRVTSSWLTEAAGSVHQRHAHN